MTDSPKPIQFGNCLNNLCYPDTGIVGKNLRQQEDAKAYLLASLDYIGTLLSTLPKRASGPIEAANRTLVCGCINDLLMAFHATSVGYYTQARNLMRPILESTNLIRLFHQNPKTIDSWIAGGRESKRDLAPAAVRKALYGEAPDPIEELYSFFCEAGAHPRFTGAKSYVVREKPKEKNINEVPQITAFLGGKRLYPLHTLTLFTCLFMSTVVINTLFTAYPELTEVDENTMFASFENILKFSQDHLPASEIILEMLNNLKKLRNTFEEPGR